jgi:predicted alpha-1,2-mannosidase
MIGTKNMGHTYPGATVPFGMVQLSPDTDSVQFDHNGKYNKEVYRYCSGYQYEDKTICGFSHTHFSGTGHSDLGDFLIMPMTGKLKLNPGTEENPESGYRSRFSHDTEVSEPGYYKAILEDYNIEAEMTATSRVGFHKYTSNDNGVMNIILDLMSGIYNYKQKNVWTFVRIENDTLVTGYRQTNGWARTRTVYFAMSFSKPIKEYGNKKYDSEIYKGFWRKFDETKNFPEFAGHQIRAWFGFDMKEKEELLIKFALSPTSTNGAIKNMKAEANHWDFDLIKEKAQKQWNKELSKIEFETKDPDLKETFYTALYHSFLGPIEYSDVDGAYKGLDQNIHYAKDFQNYTIFSLWDTYRALHPLFNIIQTKRNADMVESMLAHQEQSVHGMLPIWSHYANENWCMTGYHSVSVVADAIIKGNYKGDKKRALNACVETSRQRYFDGLGHYMDLGYVPEDKSSASVSKTLEYAYNDFCIEQIASQIGMEEIATEYHNRSLYYENVYDPQIGYMRPKLSNGEWRPEFDIFNTHGQGFIEGNAWNYGLYVPHQLENMIEIMGGKKKFYQHLDSLFTMELDDEHIAHNEDITRDGIIGLYVHGNEPGHHIPYLYNWTGKEWKTQERVRMICKSMYTNDKDGLCGNDDAGQMSAWYIFSSLGFYPVCPGTDEYALGSPTMDSATINLENGNTLKIIAKNQSDKNVYVKSISVNGTKLDRNYILHNEIMNGGEIIFEMSSKKRRF